MRSTEDENHLTEMPAASIHQPAVQAELKKQGKEKKPDGNLVSRAFPEQ